MFELPQLVQDRVAYYKTALDSYQKGEMSDERFKAVRVPWGIYSQRRSDLYMMRVRLPGGSVQPSQLGALASASEQFGDGVLHVTTRQDIQLHGVSLQGTIAAIDYLHRYQLSPYGGGGNTVRNILGCPRAGVCRREIFDVGPHVEHLSEYLLQEETSVRLPRKFKIGVAGCRGDCVGCLINDVGLLAKIQNDKKGFAVYCGGGMGAKSSLGFPLDDFVEEGRILPVVVAIRNVFNAKGDRKNKRRNRLRFLLEDLGIDAFRELYFEELASLEKTGGAEALAPVGAGDAPTPAPIPAADRSSISDFGVEPQRQQGLSTVELRIPGGDLSVQSTRELVALQQETPGITFRTNQRQNLIIVGVQNRYLGFIRQRSMDILDDPKYPDTLLDVVSCKGATTCNLGLCNSTGLANALQERIRADLIDNRFFRELSIRISGCPNACGQHPISPLGFYGMVKKVSGRTVPFYRFLMGGKMAVMESQLAAEVGILPARNVPAFLSDFLNEAENAFGEQEDVESLLSTQGLRLARALLPLYQNVPDYEDSPDFYRDWGASVDFSLDGLGKSECGAGVIDIIESDLSGARSSIIEAEKQDYESELIKNSIFLSARALLIVRGTDPSSKEEVFSQFVEKLVMSGIADEVFLEIPDVYDSIMDGQSHSEKMESFQYATRLLDHINELYGLMDSSFNFPVRENWKKQEPASMPSVNETIQVIQDLRGTPCPLNFVKAKIFLEALKPGDVANLLLDDGEPIINVSQSLKEEGHEIIDIESVDEYYSLSVRKQ